ncbi:MAG TPA: hypothetical protein VJ927_06825 [Actinomycetota bacterium]|nr:hypothetical protein [Actinomycetota bacterium]
MKRATSILVGTCVLWAAAATVSAAPKVTTVLEDPAEDANGLNDQGTGDGSMGDNVTPADASTVTDLLSVDVSNDAKNLFVTVETQTAPPATQGVGFRVRFNPDGAGGSHCIVLEAFYPGAGNDLTAAVGQLRDTCAGGDPVPFDVLGPMFVVPRKASKAFAKGAVLKAPQAQAFVYVGSSPPAGAALIHTDTTKVGKDYKLVK